MYKPELYSKYINNSESNHMINIRITNFHIKRKTIFLNTCLKWFFYTNNAMISVLEFFKTVNILYIPKYYSVLIYSELFKLQNLVILFTLKINLTIKRDKRI